MRFLLVLLFLVGCSNHSFAPKFVAGDCIADNNDREFKELYIPHVRRVLEVGNSNYKYRYYSVLGEYNIGIMDEYYHLIDSSICESRGY
jgi:hypothetical protein